MLRSIAAAAMLTVAAADALPAMAQAPSAPVAAPEPARLAAAQALIEALMPTAQRDAMIEGMVRPIMDNVRSAVMSSPTFDVASAEDEKLVAVIDAFLEEQFERSMSDMQASMPMMFDAMARAYARRFTLDELKAITTFYETPAGRSFASQMTTIMSDPDLVEAQRQMMIRAMARTEEQIAALAAKLTAEQKRHQAKN